MAEIGDVTRFTHKKAIAAFAGIKPGVNGSGDYSQKSVRASKYGSPVLRKTLFKVMDVLIKTKRQEDPVYLFMGKKRTRTSTIMSTCPPEQTNFSGFITEESMNTQTLFHNSQWFA